MEKIRLLTGESSLTLEVGFLVKLVMNLEKILGNINESHFAKGTRDLYCKRPLLGPN